MALTADDKLASYLDRKFADYDRENPQVYALFKKFAILIRKSGRSSYGAKSIMERIRWEMDLKNELYSFKINNNFTSRYVRKLILDDNSFGAFFQTRRIRS